MKEVSFILDVPFVNGMVLCFLCTMLVGGILFSTINFYRFKNRRKLYPKNYLKT